MERLDILIALQKASEAVPPGIYVMEKYRPVSYRVLPEKRNKRPRAHSPSNNSTPPVPPAATPAARGVSITVPPRGSVGPQPSVPFSREPKARREALWRQLPLQEGRKVAFHPPQNASKAAESGAAGKDEEWILAVVTKCINQDKNRLAKILSNIDTLTGLLTARQL